MKPLLYMFMIVILLSGCSGDWRLGPVIHLEDSKARYMEIRRYWGNAVYCATIDVPGRRDLKEMKLVRGNIWFVCSELHGRGNPRLVMETESTRGYQVVSKWTDEGSFQAFTKAVGLVVTQEVREIQAITIREVAGGHRMKAAKPGVEVKLDTLHPVDKRWNLEGATMDQLARFLETQYRRPVVNKTPIKGRLAIFVSSKSARNFPSRDNISTLDDLGLELRWDKVKVLVTVVKDP